MKNYDNKIGIALLRRMHATGETIADIATAVGLSKIYVRDVSSGRIRTRGTGAGIRRLMDYLNSETPPAPGGRQQRYASYYRTAIGRALLARVSDESVTIELFCKAHGFQYQQIHHICTRGGMTSSGRLSEAHAELCEILGISPEIRREYWYDELLSVIKPTTIRNWCLENRVSYRLLLQLAAGGMVARRDRTAWRVADIVDAALGRTAVTREVA